MAGFKEVDVQAPIETDSMILGVDPKTGAISRLLDKNTSIFLVVFVTSRPRVVL